MLLVMFNFTPFMEAGKKKKKTLGANSCLQCISVCGSQRSFGKFGCTENN